MYVLSSYVRRRRRTVAPQPTRGRTHVRHTRRVSGHDSSAASDVPTDDEVPEVKVVLVPPSEKKQLRESLAAAKMTIASQRSALQAAHDALAAAGLTAAAEAAAAALASEAPLPETPSARSERSGESLKSPIEIRAVDIEPFEPPPPAAPAVASPAVEAKPPSPAPPKPAAEPAAAPSASAADDEWVEEDGKPKCGFTTIEALKSQGLKLTDGDGREFDLRIGPDYKRHGKKAPSIMHTYHAISIDVFKRKSIKFNVAQHMTLPPPPDGKSTPNKTGLPRRLMISCPLGIEAPSIFGSATDGACYQVVLTFGATAAALEAWQKSEAPACKLFERFCKEAPEGLLPQEGNLEIKERLKLLPKADNIKALGVPSFIAGYNGKPALITKSGTIYRGDDYMELGINTFRFGIVTRKGIAHMIGVLKKADFHAAITIEGRADEELPEQTLAAARIQGLDLPKIAKEVDW